MVHSSPSSDLTIEDAWESISWSVSSAVSYVWTRTTRRMREAGAIVLFLLVCSLFVDRSSLPEIAHTDSLPIPTSMPHLPKITLHYEDERKSHFNASKVAFLVENRPNPILAPLILHFMSVVPPDWRFHFMGSLDSVALVNDSLAIQHQVQIGKLDLTYIPSNMSTENQEMISRFLTNLWLYETLLHPAEWLLVFQTDSMLCANSRQSLNSWLEYDWVGAPWHPTSRFGGNGGLSLRRVSAIIDVLKNQERELNGLPEDVWLTDRLGHRPNAKLANGTASITFSGENIPGQGEIVKSAGSAKAGATHFGDVAGELVKGVDDWRAGFYEPMGYHTGGSGRYLSHPIWGTPQLRKHIWEYCPEVKMTLAMDAAAYVPGSCGEAWKRSDEELTPRTEIIDGVEYPMLPEGFGAW
ncbi:hypothetical protein BP6252_10707 [Coleophoma cylindrospora]|uniref:DUF5672 domain-containing protein n=1 Tax=Coleophoma cylindrospora TaxID=1849047 RepID=A0A3D8QT96_9HELO|nr:hypothetical protein BP6252_10707 [Coleophoma cylindrospora]